MAGKKLPKLKINRRRRREREERKSRFAALWKKHGHKWTLTRYGKELGVGPAAISRYFSELASEWQKRTEIDTDAAIRKQLEEIAEMKEQLKAEWERSRTDGEEVITEGRPGKGGDTEAIKVTRVQRKRSGRLGQAAYIAARTRLLEREASLLGLDAPKRTEISGSGGKPLTFHVVYDDDDGDNINAEHIDKEPD